MEIRPYVDSDRAAATAMLLRRQPHMPEHWVTDELDNPTCRLSPNLVAVDDTGAIAAWAKHSHHDGMPPDLRFGGVTVRAGDECRGLGSRLHSILLTGADPEVKRLRVAVIDDDLRALAVAEHWGYERFEYGVTSRFDLVDLPAPTPQQGLELEACGELEFDDHDAVMAMLDLAETNPERASGMFITLDMLRSFSVQGSRVGRLARLDGAPVGLIHGFVFGHQLDIGYLCVHPDVRGRGIALAMKQQLHLDARDTGATWLMTTNEVGNTEIRSLNAKLGYQRMFGEYRLQRQL